MTNAQSKLFFPYDEYRESPNQCSNIYSEYNSEHESVLWVFNDTASRISKIPTDIKGCILEYLEPRTTKFYRHRILWEVEIQKELEALYF